MGPGPALSGMRKIPFVATAGCQPAEADLQAFGSSGSVHKPWSIFRLFVIGKGSRFFALSHFRTGEATWSRSAAHDQAKPVRLKTLYGAVQPRHVVAAPPGTACPLTALAAAEIAADRV